MLTLAPGTAVPWIVYVVALVYVGSTLGAVTVGAAEFWVMVGTSAAADWLPAASVAVTTKLLAVLVPAAPCARGTLIEKVAAPPVNCCEPATVSPASTWLLLLASTHTFTREFASAVPVMM